MSDWKVVPGEEAARVAEDQGIIGRSYNFAAVLLIPPSGLSPQFPDQLRLDGTIRCHGCQTPFPFQVKLIVSGIPEPGATKCPRCGNTMQFSTGRKTKYNNQDVILFCTNAFTSLRGQAVTPIALHVDALQFTPGKSRWAEDNEMSDLDVPALLQEKRRVLDEQRFTPPSLLPSRAMLFAMAMDSLLVELGWLVDYRLSPPQLAELRSLADEAERQLVRLRGLADGASVARAEDRLSTLRARIATAPSTGQRNEPTQRAER